MLKTEATRPRPTHYLDDVGRRVGRKPRSRLVRLLRLAVVLGCLGGVSGGLAVGVFLWMAQRTPREWAPYLQRRALKHRKLITESTDLVTRWLVYADRLAVADPPRLPALLGASVERSGLVPAGGVPAGGVPTGGVPTGRVPRGRVVAVGSLGALAQAAAVALPGDVIVLAPGRYRFGGYAMNFNRPGLALAPITVRAATLGDAVIESDAVVTFNVAAPFWHIENLVVTGVCGDHTYCEHAVHVVADAQGTVIRNNRFADFNAHIKINGENGRFPDGGVIEGNTLTDSAPRDTANPITPIDLVAASDWRISGNVIADFVRTDPDKPTYGAFVKGAGERNVLERNLVICEWKLRVPGQHIGLSLGGGGTDLGARREQGRSGFEQIGGVIRDNLIAGCSDDGIYLNRAARSVVDHNTLLDTAGVDARFIETSAVISANIVDGVVRARDGATVRERGNAAAGVLGLFLGWHPQRGDYLDPARLDLMWRRVPEGGADPAPRVDLCGRVRGDPSPPGAFVDFAPCLLGR